MSQIRISQGKWKIEGSALRKLYIYRGLQGPDSQLRLQVEISRSHHPESGESQGDVVFLFEPPLWHAEDDDLVAQLTPLQPTLDYPLVNVQIASGGNGTMTVRPLEPSDADVFLDAIAKCRMMRLSLKNGRSKHLELTVPNDAQYGPTARQFFR